MLWLVCKTEEREGEREEKETKNNIFISDDDCSPVYSSQFINQSINMTRDRHEDVDIL
jgi:hypothetical protein